MVGWAYSKLYFTPEIFINNKFALWHGEHTNFLGNITEFYLNKFRETKNFFSNMLQVKAGKISDTSGCKSQYANSPFCVANRA